MELEKTKVNNRYGMALTSLILGILSYPMLFIMLIMSVSPEMNNTVLGIIVILVFMIIVVGLVFGALSLKSSEGKKMALSGFILSIIPLALLFILLTIGLMME